jgi:predicted nucleotidyltransferase
MERQLKGLFSVALYPDELVHASGSTHDQILMHQLTREYLSRGILITFGSAKSDLAVKEIDPCRVGSRAMPDRFMTFRRSGALDVIDTLAKLASRDLVTQTGRLRKLVTQTGRWPDPALANLVVILVPVWCRVTGEKKTKLSTTDTPDNKGVYNSKTSRFAKWLATLISDAVGTVRHEELILGGEAAREAVVHAAARTKRPELVAYYDDLLERRDVLQAWIGEQGAYYGTAAVKHLYDVSKALAEAALEAEAVLKACRAADVKRITNIIRSLRENRMMDMRPEWLRGLREWAQANEAVRQLWLFDSRARGDAREDSDVDIALALMPPDGKHDWALGAYFSLELEWKAQLKAIVERHVSLEVIVPATEPDVRVRREGVLLWARE